MTELVFLVARTIGALATLVASRVGNGSVIGGRIALMVMPRFLARARRDLDFPIVFVMGSNGKTTTAKYLVHVAESAGETVLTNTAGSNMKTGIAALVIGAWRGIRRGNYSLGVFEIDEAYAASIAADLSPEFAVVLNVQIDQIYRLHEPERVRDMFANTMPFVTRHIVVNGNDGLLVDASTNEVVRAAISSFGLDGTESTQGLGLVDTRPLAKAPKGTALSVAKDGTYLASRARARVPLRVPTSGLHFALNGVAALEMASVVLDDRTTFEQHVEHLTHVTPAFGRGETIVSGSAQFDVVLFKNRPSLQLNLNSANDDADTVVIAFDEYSQDPSWLFAVDYSTLSRVDVVSGEKADFVELALRYAGIDVGSSNTDIVAVVSDIDERFRDRPEPSIHRLFLDYDQMMATRNYFGKKMGATE
jgi:UDP-N-acetylmuramyl pentapeptide synthase